MWHTNGTWSNGFFRWGVQSKLKNWKVKQRSNRYSISFCVLLAATKKEQTKFNGGMEDKSSFFDLFLEIEHEVLRKICEKLLNGMVGNTVDLEEFFYVI